MIFVYILIIFLYHLTQCFSCSGQEPQESTKWSGYITTSVCFVPTLLPSDRPQHNDQLYYKSTEGMQTQKGAEEEEEVQLRSSVLD